MTTAPSPRLPQQEEMLAAVVQGLARYNTPVPYREADDSALAFLGLSDVLDGVSDRRVRDRLGFARSLLKRIGVVDNPLRGSWALTDSGRQFAAMDADEAQRELFRLMAASYAERSAGPFLQEAQDRAPFEITVRELISKWGVTRRGASINQQIHDDLESVGLRTEPNFVTSWVDAEVMILPNEDATLEVPALPEDGRQFWEDDISLTVGSLRSANSGVKEVAMDDPLLKAESIMMRYDYSQLAVMSGPRSLRGAISWQSIAQARLRDPAASRAGDCLEPARTVRAADHLLNVVPEVVKRGFVFVHAVDGGLSGIVTMADLSEQFVSFANPFLLVGEIERWLRRALDSVFTVDELRAASNSNDPDRAVASAGNLTLGEEIRLLENPESWARLRWPAERSVFIGGMREVLRIRNEIMHFSPDPLSDEDLAALNNTLAWLRQLMAAR